ncbi:B3 domain-containing transcription factor VRN1 [Linum grandiflorum]
MAEKAAAARPRFYTCILATHDPTLQIPETFVAEHGSQLSKKVVLKLPSGAEWQVKVARSRGGKMWFDEGWREFVEFYSISPDHLMAFEFNGHGNFFVFIFAQIVYRTQQLEQADVHVKVECVESDSYAESLPSPKRREKPPLESVQPPSKLRRRTLNSDDRRGGCIRDEGFNQDVDLAGASKKRKLMTFDGEEKSSCLARATAAFKSKNPFILKVMQPSYLTTGNKVLYLPSTFFLENFKEKSGDMFLHVHGGKTWTVEYSVYENAAVFPAKPWGKFARDNGLKVGDVCVFEVPKGQTKKPALNVVIFRAHQGVDPDTPHQDVHSDTRPNSTGLQLDDRANAPNDQVKLTKDGLRKKKKLTEDNRSVESGDKHRSGNPRKQSNQILHSSGGLEAANAFTSDVPFFKIVISSSHLSRSSVTIPTKFHKHIGDCRDAELWFRGRCRGVDIRHDADLRGRVHARKFITRNWTEFAAANSLKEGDVCIFELVKGEPNDGDDGSRRSIDIVTLLVHVFRR